ncbi:MAG: GNAT family protein [Acidimicrobiales bacterium]|jgi:RimJ/RimL family protein N-acetyltransferase
MAQLLVHRHTERLTLRPFHLDDLDDLSLLYGNAEVARYLYWGPRDRAESLATLERHLQRPEEIIDENVLPVAVVLRESGRVVGDFMLRWTRNEHRQGEVGGSLHPDVHGRGLAVEIYAVLLEIGFEQYALHRIVGRCDGRNAASIRSLEKAGLRREAHLVQNEFVKGEWTDEVILAVRREQWEQSGHARPV